MMKNVCGVKRCSANERKSLWFIWMSNWDKNRGRSSDWSCYTKISNLRHRAQSRWFRPQWVPGRWVGNIRALGAPLCSRSESRSWRCQRIGPTYKWPAEFWHRPSSTARSESIALRRAFWGASKTVLYGTVRNLNWLLWLARLLLHRTRRVRQRVLKKSENKKFKKKTGQKVKRRYSSRIYYRKKIKKYA